METFCGCNDKWEQSKFPTEERDDYQLVIDKYCPSCRLSPWLKPTYENMMFDLKEMNLM